MRNLIIYGGTFDPIHNGHIKTALKVQKHFNFDCFIFLPCKIPVLKNQALATAAQRVEMLELALAPFAKKGNFKIDLSEVNRESPSYMVDSLEQFRKQLGNKTAITLLMGRDTFNQLPSWYHWLKLLTLANILVINRAGYSERPDSEQLNYLIETHKTCDESALTKQSHGLIYSYDAGIYDVSSSWIRQQINKNENLQGYLADSVLDYIRQNHLYS
ncbi:MAG: nicotinate-nucleotide adenylyltransferase [Tatlockia sp.]|nr:nicotinate-nucleotide adenylyltransferase [Tatlockia sp.]